ncbi:hypothetical protein BH24CHL1_BH24CHL1_10320 [soil metagenome]|jgi:hypothetical protein
MSGPSVFGPDVYASRRDVDGVVVAVLRGVTDQRGLYLTELRSRAVSKHAVHELMITNEQADPETTVNHVALIAFFEVENSGVLLVGDQVYWGDTLLGMVAGFNETHMPNHQNICLKAEEIRDGETLDLSVEDKIHFRRG